MATIIILDDCRNILHITGSEAFDLLVDPDKSLSEFIRPCAKCSQILLHQFSVSPVGSEWDPEDRLCETCFESLS